MMLLMTIGERVAQYRVKMGLSQYALAKAAKVSTTYIQKLERNEAENLSLSHLRRVARVLGRKIGDILEDPDYDPVRDEYLEAARHLAEYIPGADLPVVIEFSRGYSLLPEGERAEAWRYIAYFFKAKNIKVDL